MLNNVNLQNPNKTDLILEALNTMSEDIVTFDGVGGMPLKKLKVNIEPVQEGTGDPSPDNVRPITGWTGAKVSRTGKNLLDQDTLYGRFKQSDGTFYGTTNSMSSNSMFSVPDSYIGKKLRFSFDLLAWGGTTEGKAIFARCSDGGITSGTIITYPDVGKLSVTRTIQTNNAYFMIGFNSSQYVTVNNFMVEVLDDDETPPISFEPFGTNYSISFPSEAGTVYGGTLDVTCGVLTLDKKMISYDGTENWKIVTGASQRFYITKPSDSIKANAKKGYVLSHFSDLYSEGNSGTWGKFVVGGSDFKALDSGANFADLAAFKAWLAEQNANGTPLQILYPLASPVTYQISPVEVQTLLGKNNIWADTGDVEVQYGQYLSTLKEYIDAKVADLQAQIDTNEEVTP